MKRVVLDEYADMKPFVWKEIIRPALMDTKGDALFIGTPKGKNHFYELYKKAQGATGWKTWQFKSRDNPFLDKNELDAIQEDYKGSSDIARQELDASFEAFAGGIFKEEWLKYGPEPQDGDWYVAVDLAGFESSQTERGKSGGILDETCISVVKVNETGWWVKKIDHGRWDVRETALRILMAVRECKGVRAVGIEAGALKNAVMPYLNEVMRQYGVFPRVEELTHGGKAKEERVRWALQGRFERGRVVLNEGEWNKPFREQYLDFPNRLAHDDMIDSLAYVDQMAVPVTLDELEGEEYQYEPLDLIAGY